jgi:hypothetical protein
VGNPGCRGDEYQVKVEKARSPRPEELWCLVALKRPEKP